MSVEEELRKVDLIRERTRLGYDEARQLLSEAGGDVVTALILWERRRGVPAGERPPERPTDRVRELIRRGNRSRVRVQRGGETYLDIPVTAGVVAALLAPYLAVGGALACLALGCSVSVSTPERSPRQAVAPGPGDGTP